MADPSAVISRKYKDMTECLSFKVKNAEALMAGGMAAVDLATGLAEFADDAAGLAPAGVIVGEEAGKSPITGTNLATEGDIGASVRGNVVLRDVTVTGVSAYADIGKFVYMTDGQTFTLTRPSVDAIPYGLIVDKARASTNTTCDVYVFDFVIGAILSIAKTKTVEHLGYVEADALLDATDAIKLLDKQMFGHGKITKIYAVSQGYNTDLTAGSVICNFAIEGTTIKTAAAAAVTLTLLESTVDAASDRGTTTDLATAIGAANEFHDGDNLTMTIVNSGSTPFSKTAGTGWGAGWNIEAEIEWLPGA